MTSILRQLVAGPRAKHEETGLDLCYVTSEIIATSGPSQTYPQRAYRNPLDRLVAFLDAKHGSGWAIWEFRAEGTGYPDEAVYNRIRHYPWPDHHPPPFRLVPLILASMRNWLRGEDVHVHGYDDGRGPPEASSAHGPGVKESSHEDGDGSGASDRVVVVHCKAGKGRSGTMACSYLIAECGWTPEDALARFTERRMRPGFGAGVSIPSQLRWVSYVERWTKGGKKYVDRPVEVVEVHVWGLRHGVKIAVEGFVDEGKMIHVFHTFKKEERIVVEGDAPGGGGVVDMVQDMAGYSLRAKVDDKGEVVEDADYGEITKGVDSEDDGNSNQQDLPSRKSSKRLKGSRTTGLMGKLAIRRRGSAKSLTMFAKDGNRSKTIEMPQGPQTSGDAPLPGNVEVRSRSTTSLQNGFSFADPSEPGGQAVIFKPAKPIRIPNCDVNITVERRNRAPAGMGLTMVTAVAHVWFNAFFEGHGPEQGGKADESGVFEIDWDKMDGIKGSSQKGTKALDRLSVVWRVAGPGERAAEEEETASAGVAIEEPGVDSPIPQMRPANWKGGGAEEGDAEDTTDDKPLGLRLEPSQSQGAKDSRAAREGQEDVVDEASLEGVKVSGPEGEEVLDEAPTGQGTSSSSAIKGHDGTLHETEANGM
ncbi:hypothetical protein VTK56DRAFT_8410 [Thermocarpiscus australiensis]